MSAARVKVARSTPRAGHSSCYRAPSLLLTKLVAPESQSSEIKQPQKELRPV